MGGKYTNLADLSISMVEKLDKLGYLSIFLELYHNTGNREES